MTKGLFTSLEEIRFQNVLVNGNIIPQKGSALSERKIREENRFVSQKVKRLNAKKQFAHFVNLGRSR